MGKYTIKTKEGKIIDFFPKRLNFGKDSFLPLRQNKSVNAFMHMGNRHATTTTMKGHTQFMDAFSITKSDHTMLAKSKANILFDFLNLKAYQNYYDTTRIAFTLEEYATFTGQKPSQKLKYNIIDAIECLECVNIRLCPIEQISKVDHVQIPIMTGFHAVQGGKFLIEFYDGFFEHLSKSPIMNVHCGIYSADQRKFKYLSLMGRFIEEQRRINHHNSRRDKEGLLLMVKSLWESDPDAPTYEEISKTSRRYGKQIIEPFESHMNELACIIGFDWLYCDKNGKPFQAEKLYQDGRVKIIFKNVL